MKIFQNCTAKKLDVRRLRVSDDEDPSSETELTQFLKNQATLQNLSLYFFHEASDLLDGSLNHVNFKLSTLKLKYFDNYTSNEFNDFLSNFKDSLTYLTVDKCHHDILNLFVDFKKLKDLNVYHICSHFEPLLSVENLTVACIDGDFSEKFPATKNLTIYFYAEDLQQINNLKKLEKLTFIDCKIPELKIPQTVRKLTLYRVTLLDPKAFNYDDIKIEELEIIKCKDCDWLMDFLTIQDLKIKKLKIVKSILSEECRKVIAETSKLIKSVQIINCEELKEEELESESNNSSENDEEGSEESEEGSESNSEHEGEEGSSSSESDDQNHAPNRHHRRHFDQQRPFRRNRRRVIGNADNLVDEEDEWETLSEDENLRDEN